MIVEYTDKMTISPASTDSGTTGGNLHSTWMDRSVSTLLYTRVFSQKKKKHDMSLLNWQSVVASCSSHFLPFLTHCHSDCLAKGARTHTHTHTHSCPIRRRTGAHSVATQTTNRNAPLQWRRRLNAEEKKARMMEKTGENRKDKSRKSGGNKARGCTSRKHKSWIDLRGVCRTAFVRVSTNVHLYRFPSRR